MTFRARLLFPALMIVILAALLYPIPAYGQDAATPTPIPTDIPTDVPTAPEAPASPLSTDPTPDLIPASISPDLAAQQVPPSFSIPSDCQSTIPYDCVYYIDAQSTRNFYTIQDALDAISNQYKLLPLDKKIYVRTGNQTGNVILNGIDNSILANLIGFFAVNSQDEPVPLINGTIVITGTTTGFTLSGFNVEASSSTSPALSIHDTKGALTLTNLGIKNDLGDALIISNQSGAVIVSNVSASDSGGKGAEIINNVPAAAYPVTIKNSEFDDNGAAALTVDSRGAVTLDGVSASRSAGGLTVSNASSITMKNSFFGDSKSGDGVVLSPANLAAATMDTVFINGNTGKGLVLNSLGGAVTLNNLSVSGNAGSGLTIGTTIAPAGAIKITNSDLNNNGSISSDWGLQVYSKSSITLAQVSAAGNKGGGISLDNCLENGGKCAFTAPVTMTSSTGIPYSSNAGDSGIYIRSNGSVSVSDFISSNNLRYGVDIFNAFSGSLGNVTLRAILPGWTNSIIGNGLSGISIQSNGVISLDRITSSKNNQNGALLINQNAVTPKPVDVKNSAFDDNEFGGGLYVNSKGAVTLTGVSASGNSIYGASIYNMSGIAAVSILPGLNNAYSSFNSNKGDRGLSIQTFGTVIVKNIHADGNLLGGLFIDNQNSASIGVSVSNSTFNRNGSGTLGSGLEIYSLGAVNLSNLAGNENADRGAQVGINNSPVSQVMPVLVNLTNGIFNSNGGAGLTIVAKGNVTLNSITASSNGLLPENLRNGLLVDNCVFLGTACLGLGSVSLGGTNVFSGNGAAGGLVDSRGNITLSNVTANGNGMQGLFLNNARPGSLGNISISALTGYFNELSNNGFSDPNHAITYSGINASSFGNINLSRTKSLGNSGLGIYLDNCITSGGICTAPYIKTVNLGDITASSNQYQGIAVSSRGAVNLTNVLAESNSFTMSSISLAANSGLGETISDRLTTSNAVDQYYFQGTLNQSITITLSSSDFNTYLALYESSSLTPIAFNAGSGDPITSSVDVILPANGIYKIAVSSTGRAGDYKLSLFPSGGSAPASDTIYANGIQVVTGGVVTVRNITANNNARDGVVILTTAAITGTNVNASDNGEHGVNVSNQYGLISNLTLTGGTALGNDKEGYNLWSYGSITLSGLTSNNSENGNGIFINQWQPIADPPNTWGYVSSRPITLSQITTSDNAAKTGLFVQASGNLSLNGIISQNNNRGVYLVTIPPSGIVTGKITVQNLTGMNRISGNVTDGLKIESSGAVTIDRVLARENGENGINIVNSKTLTVTNSSLLYNQKNGLEAAADGLVTLTNLISIANGTSVFPGDGIKLTLSSDPVAFNSCAFLANHGSGIEVINGSTFSLVATSFFGNNTNGTPGLLNFWWHTLP